MKALLLIGGLLGFGIGLVFSLGPGKRVAGLSLARVPGGVFGRPPAPLVGPRLAEEPGIGPLPKRVLSRLNRYFLLFQSD